MKTPRSVWTREVPRCLAGLLPVVIVGCALSQQEMGPQYVEEVEAWRADRQERLESETGWLTLVGLHWLGPGENRFGTGSHNEIVLPEGRAPASAGSFFLDAGQVTARAPAEVGLTLDGELVTDRELRADGAGEPDVLLLNGLRLNVINRGDRHAIRVRDPASPVRKNFTGMDYFPIDPAYRVEATFEPYERPREVEIPTVLGTVETMLSPGYVEFFLHGKTLRLEPVVGSLDDDELFFIFKDETSGRETYDAGRFLYADMPESGRVALDFNKSYNPPCVFTPYATCPLPPKHNALPVRIQAGEKTYGDH